MKKILFLAAYILVVSFAYAQPNDTIVQWLTKKKHINFENYIFIPNELMKFCEDSVGQNLFRKNLTNYISKPSADQYEYQEKQVLITIIYNAVKQGRPLNKVQQASQDFLTSSMAPFLLTFKVHISLLLNRFTWSETRAETCDIEQSLYVFFCYDPELYLKACESHKNLRKQDAPFPFSCTLENVNIPQALRRKMRIGILNRLKDYDDTKLLNISEAIKNFNINEF